MDVQNRTWIENKSSIYLPLTKATRVLEIGSFIVDGQYNLQCRKTIEPMVGEYVGLDMRWGPGVNVVCDAKAMPPDWTESFDIVICLDTIEHMDWPHEMMPEITRVLKPGGVCYLSSVFDFAIHGFPNDYWRFTPEGIKLLLERGKLHVLEYEGVDGSPNWKPVVTRGVGKKPCVS